VQRPLATVVIGGVIGAMVMSLLVLRVLYLLFNSIAGPSGPSSQKTQVAAELPEEKREALGVG
jgi:cobalt-zinc-cadmium resistance protein CzcA